MFYPLLGLGGAVNMCYRTLYIGTGEPARSLGGALDLQPKDGHLKKPFQRLMGLTSECLGKETKNPDNPMGYFLGSGLLL